MRLRRTPVLALALAMSACVPAPSAPDAGPLPGLDAFVPGFLCASDDACRALRGPAHRCDLESQLCYLPGTCDPLDVTLARCHERAACESGACPCAPDCRAGERCLRGTCRADVEGGCCSHDDCVSLRGEGWLCEPESRLCYRPGDCDEGDPSIAPCAGGARCREGRCDCGPIGSPMCRLDEECDSRFSEPECVARFARPLCTIDTECPPYASCEVDAIGGYCVLRDGFCDEPPPTHAGCEDAIAVEPPAELDFVGELLPTPSCEHIPPGGSFELRWYRVRVPARHGLGVVVPTGVVAFVAFYVGCALDVPCEPFDPTGEPSCSSYANAGDAELEVYVVVGADAPSVHFRLAPDASGCESI